MRGFPVISMDGAPPVLPRESSLHRAPLVQLLADLDIAQAPASPLSLAQRWSPWLAWTDAIALSAVLAAGDAPAPGGARVGLSAAVRQAIDDAGQLRDALSRAILDDPLLRLPAEATDPADAAAGLRRQHRLHQQALDERIGTLRARLRAVMPPVSPAMARLAALDAVLDPSLAGRQRQLLAVLPAWLDRGARRSPARPRPARLPADAASQVRAALLAELDLRWQPVAGLIEALQDAAGPAGPVIGQGGAA